MPQTNIISDELNSEEKLQTQEVKPVFDKRGYLMYRPASPDADQVNSNDTYNNYKTYLLFVIFAYLLRKIEHNYCEIRPYRNDQINEILEILRSHHIPILKHHAVPTVYSLKSRLETVIDRQNDPGMFKTIKRAFHGTEFFDVFTPALEDGQKEFIQNAMQSLKILPENLLKNLESIFALTRSRGILQRNLFTRKPDEDEGNDPILFKRTLLFHILEYVINQVNNGKTISSDIKLYFEAVCKDLLDDTTCKLPDLINALNAIPKAMIEQGLVKEPEAFKQFLETMAKVIKNAENADIQSVMKTAAIPFEMYTNILEILGKVEDKVDARQSELPTSKTLQAVVYLSTLKA